MYINYRTFFKMKMQLNLFFVLCLVPLLVYTGIASAGQTILKSDHDIISLKNELNRTYKMGYAFLEKAQNPDGSWSNPGFPALTGLVTYAFLTSPGNIASREKPGFIQKALDFIVSNAHENGAIYKEGMPNYNTSICMMALLAANDSKYHPYILKARRYVATLQLDQGEKGVADQPYDGGIGYGTKDHSDMSNTYIALEALKASEFLESDDQLAVFSDLKGLQKESI